MRQLLSLTYHECWQGPSAAIDYTQATHLLGIRRGAQNQLIRHLSHLLFQIHCGVHLWRKEKEESVSSATFSFCYSSYATHLIGDDFEHCRRVVLFRVIQEADGPVLLIDLYVN